VKQNAPDYRAFWNPAEKHPDNLSGRLSRETATSLSPYSSLKHATNCQAAHNNVAKVIENDVKHINPETDMRYSDRMQANWTC